MSDKLVASEREITSRGKKNEETTIEKNGKNDNTRKWKEHCKKRYGQQTRKTEKWSIVTETWKAQARTKTPYDNMY